MTVIDTDHIGELQQQFGSESFTTPDYCIFIRFFLEIEDALVTLQKNWDFYMVTDIHAVLRQFGVKSESLGLSCFSERCRSIINDSLFLETGDFKAATLNLSYCLECSKKEFYAMPLADTP